jgi:small subunit ribosomal protein S16
MVKIRLRRTGAKKQPHYRVVVADSKSPRDGKFIETIGHYNPRTEPPTIEIDAPRALYWLNVGAQPSAAVKRMLDKLGIMAQAAAMKEGKMPEEPLGLPPLLTELEEEAPQAEEEEEETPAEEEEEEMLAEEEEEEDEEEEDEDLDELDDSDEDLDELDDWEAEAEEADESDDLEDDWEMDVEDDDDFDEDPLDEDDE